MEDGPEAAEGTYEYAGHSYRLREEESEKWRVFDGDRYLGVVIAVDGSDGPEYALDFAGEETSTTSPRRTIGDSCSNTSSTTRVLSAILPLSAVRCTLDLSGG